jgi:uncharacterized protein DUF6931
MALIRFATARDLFEAFETAQQDVDAEPSDAAPLDYLRSLADGGELDKAVTFCAYLLPRREAVAWGCWSVRRLADTLPPPEEAGVRAAEDWVEVPEEDRRIAALQLGTQSDYHAPSTWLALAAGWSGGNIAIGFQNTYAPPPPQQTARAVRAALAAAVARLAPDQRQDRLRTCVEAGIRIAAEEEP